MSFVPIRVDYLSLVKALADDLDIDPYTVSYVVKRFCAEGVTFLTVTLPKLSKAVLRGLETGVFDRSDLTCFAWKGRSLRIFRSLLARIFDVAGNTLEHACSVAIYQLRQFCEYFYKLALPFEEEDLHEAREKFLQIERENANCSFENGWADTLRKNFESFYPRISRAEVHQVFAAARPRFGPGSFAGSQALRRLYPHWAVHKGRPGYEVGSHPAWVDGFSGYFRAYPASLEKLRPVEETKRSEVLFVPKDSRGPRVISKEPLLLVKGQMALFDWITPELERVTAGSIQFGDQTKFRELARVSSLTRSHATLDLKDASDRVRYDLIKHMTKNSPALRWFLAHMRSTSAELDDGSIHSLKKLSGMGSGLTFPLMALLIHVSICSYVRLKTGLPYNSIMRAVFVYGDDVIVPREWYEFAVTALGRSKLVVNSEKSFVKGNFRESCGGDYYRGNDVGPVRLRLAGAELERPKNTPKKGSSALRVRCDRGVMQVERHARELVKAGLRSVSEVFYKALQKVLRTLPYVSGQSPVLGRYVCDPCLIDEIHDGALSAYAPQAVLVYDDGQCPYKVLGRHLNPTEVARDSVGLSFGEIALPQKLKLRKRPVYGVNRR